MLNDINMEFIQAFNPLYAVPIVAVILCAFIVYAFGFKSPVPPPSFEGIEEEKKYTKKRKVKDNQKKEKLIQNGKANGSAATKSSAPSSKKKETAEKQKVEKTAVAEKKSPNVEKKANKKARLQTEKKSTQEKKKESISHDDFNEDGWVQLVSKKGRKNQKKNDAAATETQSVASVLSKTIDATKLDDNSKVEESPKKKEEHPKDITKTDEKQQTSATKKENAATKPTPAANVEKVKIQNVVVEEPKPDINVEKQHPKEAAANSPKVLEESNKPKKKKKKNADIISEKDSISKPKSVSDSSVAQVTSEIPAPPESNKPVIVEDLPPVNKVVETDQLLEVKTSNVAFDELAGLYPETKEPKKKKKVRRDH